MLSAAEILLRAMPKDATAAGGVWGQPMPVAEQKVFVVDAEPTKSAQTKPPDSNEIDVSAAAALLGLQKESVSTPSTPR